jgi:hypothetical protein
MKFSYETYLVENKFPQENSLKFSFSKSNCQLGQQVQGSSATEKTIE